MTSYNLSVQQVLRRIRKILLGLLLMIFVVMALFPFVYMVILSYIESGTSLRLTKEYLQNVTWTFDNYKKVMLTGDFGRYTINTAIIAVISCFGACALSSMAAYAFAKKRFIGGEKLFMLYLATMMVPMQVTMIPLYLQMREMKLINTYIGMAIPFACGAFGTILLNSFMKNVPDELLEAADIDGASELRKFFTIVLPLVKPAIVSLMIFTFVNTWGAMIWPMLMATRNEMNTVTVAISMMKGEFVAVNYGYIMAGTTLAFLPPIILYCFLQKEFVEGIALSGTKG